MSETDEYTVINPQVNYRGKSYSDWVCDWFNWFISANPDKRNSGPVVFLTSKHIPQNIGQTNAADGTLSQIMSTDSSVNVIADPNFPTIYQNEPNIRVGSNRLQIFADQALLVPIITAYQIKTDPYQDFGNMLDYTGLIIDAGDNPPDNQQLTITRDPGQDSDEELAMKPINLGNDSDNNELTMDQFRFTTPIFTTVVPQAPYGTSMKDFLEEGPIPPGTYPAMLDGYYVMIKFDRFDQETSKTFWLHSWASAGREARGPYFSELLYEVEISQRSTRQGMVTTRFPARFEQVLNAALDKQKSQSNKIRLNKLQTISNNANTTLSNLIATSLAHKSNSSKDSKDSKGSDISKAPK